MRILPASLAALFCFGIGTVNDARTAHALPARYPATMFPYDMGAYPRSAVVGDLDEDGRLDAVVANEYSNTVMIRFGAPGGGLGSEISIFIGDSPQELALVDLDDDTHVDLVAARSLGLTVLLGNGNGTFQAATHYPTEGYPAGMAVGDVDGDDDVDVATANLAGASVSILLNQGDGTFAPRTDLATLANPKDVALGDLNHDGKADLVVGFYSTENVAVYLAQDGAAFAAGGAFATSGRTSAVTLAELNGDGHLDLVTANDHSANLSILLGDGNGGFGPRTDLATSARPLEVVCADLNADGALDVASSDEGAHSVSVFLGNGDGSFGPRAEFTSSMAPNSIAAGDLTGDGRADLLTTSPYPGVASLLIGMGDGTFGMQSQYATDTDPRSIALVDLNHDGVLDVVTGNTAAATVSVLLGEGDRTFGPQTNFPVGVSTDAIAVGRINEDDHQDVIVANGGSSSIVVLLGDGNGGFGSGTPFPAGGWPVDIELGDMNGDGATDVVTVNRGIIEGTVSILLGNGQGDFGPATSFLSGNDPNSLVLDHLNEDAHLDVAIASWWTPLLKPGSPEDEPIPGSFIGVFLGSGDGSIGPQIVYEVGHGTHSIASGDLNGDGRPDLVAAGTQMHCCDTPPPEVFAIYNTGDGTFGPEIRHATGNLPGWVEVTDWNDDGVQDLVVLRFGLNAVTLIPGLGGGAFGTPESYGVGIGPTAVALTDLDGNQTTDIAVANSASRTVSILLNQSEPAALEIPVDVQPLACPNTIYVHANGVLQVAVMGTDGFDANTLDPHSVLLNGVAPFNPHIPANDIGTPVVDPETGCICSEKAKDGRADRLFLFRTQEVVEALGLRTAGGERTLMLTGLLEDGMPVSGTDCVRITDSRRDVSPTDELLVEGLTDESGAAPTLLWELYPNPLPRSHSAHFAYRVPDPGAKVSIAIHSVAGRRLVELAGGVRAGGVHTVTWNGRDADGAQLAPGVYFVKAAVGAGSRRSTVVLLR